MIDLEYHHLQTSNQIKDLSITTYNTKRQPDIISLLMEDYNTTYEALLPKQKPGSGQASRAVLPNRQPLAIHIQQLKCGSSKLVCAVSVKHTPNHKDLV